MIPPPADQLLAAFDLDGTLIRKNVSFAFCRFLTQKGFFSKKDLLFCARCYLQHRFFALSLLGIHQKVFDRLFHGKSLRDLKAFIPLFIEREVEPALYYPALEKMQWLKGTKNEIMLLSSSPTFLVGPIARAIGIDTFFGTDYHIDKQGCLCDIATLVDGTKKAELLVREKSERKIEKTYAFSDSLLDLPFLEAACIAVAVNPQRSLKRLAKRRRWEII